MNLLEFYGVMKSLDGFFQINGDAIVTTGTASVLIHMFKGNANPGNLRVTQEDT